MTAIVMMTALRLPGCPIRKSAGQRVFAPRRGLSQLITSFIASVSQGIRHAPLLPFPFFLRTYMRVYILYVRVYMVRSNSFLLYFTVSCVSICQ